MSIDNIQANISANVKKITGESGSYDSSTSKGKAANAGEEVGKLLNGSEKNVATTSDISYSSKTEDSSVDVDAGLAYSEEVVSSVDDNDDGGITLDKNDDTVENSEQKKAEEGLGIEDISVADVNADGIVDKAEYLSLTILQDCTSEDGPDAVATAEEAVALNEYIKADAKEAVENIKAIHDGLVAEKAEEFEMPLKKAEQALEIAEENEDAAKEAISSLNITDKAQDALERTAHNLTGTDNGKIRGVDFVDAEGFRRTCKEMDTDGDSYVSKEEAEKYINDVSFQTEHSTFNDSGETAVFVAENFGFLTQAAKGKEDAFYIHERFNGYDGIKFDISKTDLYVDIIADEVMKDDRMHNVTGYVAGSGHSVNNVLKDIAGGGTGLVNNLELTDELIEDAKEFYITKDKILGNRFENELSYDEAKPYLGRMDELNEKYGVKWFNGELIEDKNESTVQQTPVNNSVSSTPVAAPVQTSAPVASAPAVSQPTAPVTAQNADEANEQIGFSQQLIQLLQFAQMLGIPVATLAEMMNIDLSEFNLFQSIMPESQQEQSKSLLEQFLELFKIEN